VTGTDVVLDTYKALSMPLQAGQSANRQFKPCAAMPNLY
jgi:hypothetical protein